MSNELWSWGLSIIGVIGLLMVGHKNWRGYLVGIPAGFDNDKHGYLYLMRHEKWGLFQVGISNSAYTRVK